MTTRVRSFSLPSVRLLGAAILVLGSASPLVAARAQRNERGTWNL